MQWIMALLQFNEGVGHQMRINILELQIIHIYLLSLVKTLSWLDVTAEQQEILLITADLPLISPACYLEHTLFSSDMY